MSTIIWTSNNDAVASIKTRKGWPVLTIETEVTGDSKKRVQMKGVLLWLVLGLVVPVQEIFTLQWLL
jgi:hypothetical protein